MVAKNHCAKTQPIIRQVVEADECLLALRPIHPSSLASKCLQIQFNIQINVLFRVDT
jgi:hypothetical protein